MQLTVVRRLAMGAGGGGEGSLSLSPASFMAASEGDEEDGVDIVSRPEQGQLDLEPVETVDENVENIFTFQFRNGLVCVLNK